MILPFPWIIFFIQLTFANPKIKYVKKCPSNEERWMARDKEFGCNRLNNEQYHCILTSDEKLVELCIRNISIQSYHNGCPHVYVSASNKKKTKFALPHSNCSTKVKGCPSSNRTSAFLSNQLFRYPMCLKPERQRILTDVFTIPTATTSTSTSMDISSITQDDAFIKNADHPNLLLFIMIVILLLVAFTLILGIVALFCLRRRSCTRRQSRTEIIYTRNQFQEADIPLTRDAGTNDVHQMNEKQVLQAHLLFDIAKGIMWKQISLVKREDRDWKDILSKRQLKHQMYHQWHTDKCCYCSPSGKRLKKIWGISESGWFSLYKTTGKHCTAGFKKCVCLYDGEDISLRSVSIATLFTLTFFFGELSNEGRRHLKYLRQFCKEFLRYEGTETTEPFTQHLENALTNVAFHSRFQLVKEMQKEIRDLRNRSHNAEHTKEYFSLDFNDTTCFQDTQLYEQNIPLITRETEEYINQEDFYVEVDRLMKEAMERLQRDKLLIVSGHPGDGRKSMWKRLMKNMKIDSKLKLDYFQVDFDFFRKTKERHLVYFEDILGASLYACLTEYERIGFMNNVNDFLKLAEHNVLTLCSIENCKLEEAIRDLSEKERMKWKEYIMDLSSPEWKLTHEERSTVLDKFGQRYRARPLGEIQVREVQKSSSANLYFGFFENCVLYFRFYNDYNIFLHPQKQLEEEIGCLQRNFPTEFTILTYMLFTNGQFDENEYDKKTFGDIRKWIASGAYKTSPLLQLRSISDAKFIEQATRNSKLLLRTGPNTYAFQHQFVKEAVLQYICRNESRQLLKLANISVIRDYVRPSTYKERCASEVFGLIDETCDHLLAKKLLEITEISKVSKLAPTYEPHFLNSFLIKEMEDYISRGNFGPDNKQIIEAIIDEATPEENKEGNEVFLTSLRDRYSQPNIDNAVADTFYNCLEEKQPARL